MTDNTTNNGGADAGSGSALIAVDSPDEQADLPEELEIGDLPEELWVWSARCWRSSPLPGCSAGT
jgi:hypothetical protein